MKTFRRMYQYFRALGPGEIFEGLSGFEMGRMVISALERYHNKASDLERISLDQKYVINLLRHELAWRFFYRHGADSRDLERTIKGIMARHGMDSELAMKVYSSGVYYDARARLALINSRLKRRSEDGKNRL